MLPKADSGTTSSGNPLDHQLAHEPKMGDASVVEIAPGVLWLRTPLFASLPWISVWALAASPWPVPDGCTHNHWVKRDSCSNALWQGWRKFRRPLVKPRSPIDRHMTD